MQEQMQQVVHCFATQFTMHMAAFIDSMYYMGAEAAGATVYYTGQESAVKQKVSGRKKLPWTSLVLRNQMCHQLRSNNYA